MKSLGLWSTSWCSVRHARVRFTYSFDARVTDAVRETPCTGQIYLVQRVGRVPQDAALHRLIQLWLQVRSGVVRRQLWRGVSLPARGQAFFG